MNKAIFRVEKGPDGKFDYQILLLAILLHGGGLIGFYYAITGKCELLTYFWTILMFLLGSIGVGASAHRYFSHRSYKATYGLKLFLIFCQQLSGMSNIIFWSKVHRTHHKYTDTIKDPTNKNRGVLFGYIQWLWLPPVPESKLAVDKIDMDDLLNDKEVMFQYKYYELLLIIITVLFPTLIPYYFWSEQFKIAFLMNFFRVTLNFTQQNVGNSFLHANGPKPYDKTLSASESKLWIICLLGEGYHNYHHTFPFDYRASEFSGIDSWNLNAWVINLWAKLGLAYDLKFASDEMIQKRVLRTGKVNKLLE